MATRTPRKDLPLRAPSPGNDPQIGKHPFRLAGIPTVCLSDEERTAIRSLHTKCDQQRVEQFISRVEVILTKRKLRASSDFHNVTRYSMRLNRVRTALAKLVAAIEKARAGGQFHLEEVLRITFDLPVVQREMPVRWPREYLTALDRYLRRTQTLRDNRTQIAKSPLQGQTRNRGGRTPKTIRFIISEIADAYHAILGGRPSAAERSRFFRLILALRPALGETFQDPRRQIRAALANLPSVR